MQREDLSVECVEIRNRIVLVAATLVSLGMVFVYSASAIRAANFGWELMYLKRQLTWAGVGVVGFLIASLIDYRWLRKIWVPVAILSIGLLVAVLVPGVGARVRGAARWIRFAGFNMQPSEFAKYGMVLVMAALLARRTETRLPFWRGTLPLVGVSLLAAGLIALEPDFGTAALVGAVLMSMLLVGGARLHHIFLMALAAAPAAAFYGYSRMDYIRQRVQDWWVGSTDGTGYQTWMSKMALGSGGWQGMGVGEGPAKLFYLPDAHTDFILAVIGQEIGLIGTLLVVGLFVALLHEGIRLVRVAPDKFGALLAFGIVLMLCTQAAFNIAVVTASIPPKGISLPFVSFGGSGLCMAMSAVGVLVSIARQAAHTENVIVLPQISSDESSARAAA